MSNPIRHNSSRWNHLPRWSLIVLLAGLAGGLLTLLGGSATARDYPVTTNASQKENVFVVAGQISDETYGLYLVDTEKQTICVYQYEPKDRKLEWRASRTYRFDVQMDAYNTAEPLPSEVQRLADQARRLGSQ